MSLADVLNTDVGVLGARLRRGVVWWLDELAVMTEPLWSERRPDRAKVTVERRSDGGYLIRSEGRLDRLHDPAGPRLAAALILPSTAVLVRGVPAPPVPKRDIRRMIELDLDRLTPFTADAVYYDVTLTTLADGGRDARLWVAPRRQVDQAVAEALAAGVDPTGLIAADGEAVMDLLPAMQAANPAVRTSSAGRLWLAVGFLLALNVGVAIWRDVRTTNRLRTAVAAQQPVIDRIGRLRREVRDRRAQVQAQAAARAAGEPLRVLDALSRALPEDAWGQRLSWDASTVRLAGRRRAGVDVVGALQREPLFHEVRETDAAATAADSFDVVAAVSPSLAVGGGPR